MRGFVGDADIEVTYAAVGRALSAWEAVELGMATVYSIFVGKALQLDSIREYGAVNRIFVGRMEAIRKASDAYFRAHCDQDSEGDFSALCKRAASLSDNRNNIAHGIVEATTYLHNPDTWPPEQCHVELFILRPPWYTIDRLKLYDWQGMGSKEIMSSALDFEMLSEDLEKFALRLHPLSRR